MTLKEAFVVLRRFEDWRIGRDCRPIGDAFPEEFKGDLGRTPVRQAFAMVLAAQGLDKPIADCRACAYYGAGGCGKEVRGECHEWEAL